MTDVFCQYVICWPNILYGVLVALGIVVLAFWLSGLRGRGGEIDENTI